MFEAQDVFEAQVVRDLDEVKVTRMEEAQINDSNSCFWTYFL